MKFNKIENRKAVARAHCVAYEARMTAKHTLGADDARGRMSAAADSAMTHAVEGGGGARGEASGGRSF